MKRQPDFRVPTTQAGRALLRDLDHELSHNGIGPDIREALRVFIQVGVLRVEREAFRSGNKAAQ